MVKPESLGAPPPPGRLPTAARRTAILEAALSRFAAVGYGGATTRDLSAAAGVTEPILYRHFRSKAAIYAAVIEEAGARLLARLEAAVEGTDGAGARLAALADALEPSLAVLTDELRVLNGAAAARPTEEAVRAVRGVFARMGGLFARALAAPGLRPGLDPAVAGHLLLELGLGASLARPLRIPALSRPAYRGAAFSALRAAFLA
jgi:AcrR family transcriptional regulator